VIDAVIRNWEHVHVPVPLEEVSLFYIDAETISGIDAGRLQAGLDVIASGFESFGLVMNATKKMHGNVRRQMQGSAVDDGVQ